MHFHNNITQHSFIPIYWEWIIVSLPFHHLFFISAARSRDGNVVALCAQYEPLGFSVYLTVCLSVCLSVCPSLPSNRKSIESCSEGKSVYPRTTRKELHRLAVSILWESACLTAPDKVEIYSRTKWEAIPHTLAYSISFCALYTGPII